MSNIEEKVKNIISEQSGISLKEVTLVASLVYDLDMDELDRIEFVMALEDEFDIEIPDGDFDNIINVQGVINYITAKKNNDK